MKQFCSTTVDHLPKFTNFSGPNFTLVTVSLIILIFCHFSILVGSIGGQLREVLF